MTDTALVMDTGSSSMRGILFDGRGRILHKRQTGYQMNISGDKATQPAADFDRALLSIVSDTVKYAAECQYKINSITFTSQRSSLIVLDKHMRVMQDAVMWYDKRAQNICHEINQAEGCRVRKISGSLSSPVLLAPKIGYFQRSSPNVAEAAHYLSIQDYLIWRVSGELVTDPTLACRTNLMDIRKKKWSDELLALYQIRPEKLCRIVPCGSIVGTVLPSFAEMTGLDRKTPVITAGGDQQCSVLGQLKDREKEMAMTLGSGGYVVMVTDDIPDRLDERIQVSVSPWPGKYHLEMGIGKTGTLFRWCVCQIEETQGAPEKFLEMAADAYKPVRDEEGRQRKTDFPEKTGLYERLERDMACGRDFCAELSGGITATENKAEMAYLSLNCILQKVCGCYLCLSAYAPNARSIRIAGGMAKSDLVLHIIRTLTKTEVSRSAETESTALGAWMQMLTALHDVENPDEAVRRYQAGDAFY